MKKIKLFCFSYAGGTAMLYSKWKRFLNSSIQLIPVELAGRGIRSKEPFYENLEKAVEDIYEKIRNELDGTEFAVFGHSMGSLLAYELIYMIREKSNMSPVHAFFSGRYPPYIKKDEKIYHIMPEEEFIEEIYKIGGTPKEFFEHRELLDVFIPILRADYRIVENFYPVRKAEGLKFDITVFNGMRDKEVTSYDLEGWSSITEGECKIYEYNGGHFFIHDEFRNIIDLINEKLV